MLLAENEGWEPGWPGHSSANRERWSVGARAQVCFEERELRDRCQRWLRGVLSVPQDSKPPRG